jgi:hypothetical protein
VGGEGEGWFEKGGLLFIHVSTGRGWQQTTGCNCPDIFCISLKIRLWKLEQLLFNSISCWNNLYMWKFSSLFKCNPFCFIFITSVISLILPNACTVSRMCFTWTDVFLLLRMSLICSLYLVSKFRPVWPMFCRGQSMYFNLYTPGFSYLSAIFCLGNKWFLRLFVVLNAGFILVFLNNLVIYLVFFPLYVNTAHFLFSNFLAGMSWDLCGVFFFCCCCLRWI